MRKQSAFINNTKGFMLPYVLLMITIVFIAVSANISTYEQEIALSEQYMEHLKIETLLQMAQSKFAIDHLPTEKQRFVTNYEFPDGMAIINYTRTDEEIASLHFDITTHKQTQYTTVQKVYVTKD